MTDNNTNQLITFQIESSSVRGRSISLDHVLNDAIGDRYPEQIARLLGEAMIIAALVAQSMKFKGRLIIQCHGTNEGAVSLLMADCTSDGDLRGYARWDADQLKMINLDNKNPGADVLLGGGTFSMTIDQGPDMDQYQGLAAIEGPSLSVCAEHYFMQSEQIPTRLQLACGQVQEPGQDLRWRGGGMMIQRMAPDEARGETDNDWVEAKLLFKTISDEELIDPTLSQDDLLYRLFHEQGVRVLDRSEVQANCGCSEQRLSDTLKSFERAALEEMAEAGIISANCEFCNTTYAFELDKL